MSADPLRLSKLMAQRGICSRREADEYIARGLVFVDGVRVDTLGIKVFPHQTVTLAPEAAAQQHDLVTILLNKPVGYVSGQPEKGYRPAVELINPETRWAHAAGPEFRAEHLQGIAPAGRLDLDSKGRLVFTQDGRLARQLTASDSEIEKEYLVRVAGTLDSQGLALLRHGLSLDDRPLKLARVEWINAEQLRFILIEGRKRQIRRMCDQVGLKVLGLKRVRVGRVKLGNLPEGQWRFLAGHESFG
ncbi:MAG: pseudouridine synthase [Planctomycetaceae bacterium]